MQEQQNQEVVSNSLLSNILFVLKKNLFLIIAVIVLTTFVGTGYAFVKNPNYTASVRVSFSIDGDSSATINEIRQYVDTVIDFADEGVVIDRANAYYIEWLDNYKEDLNGDIKAFYKSFEKVKTQGSDTYNDIYKNYKKPTANDGGTLKDETFLQTGAVSTRSEKSKEDATNWVFCIEYTDAIRQEAIDKAYVLVLAYKHELYYDDYLKAEDQEQYFTNLNVAIDNLGLDGVGQDFSKTKTIIIAFLIGVIASLIVVYIKNLLDNTVRTRAELEILSGCQVLACIEQRREEENGKSKS